ncbi:MAG: exodeoxyribonuclease VII small subunit [Clostridiales bacterium]|nr:exodeoxyribonuclease VII small subunit [Clostridiales bacterium]
MGEQEQTLEEVFKELEEIIEKMQQREVSLEDSFRLYEQGIQKLKQCNSKIDYVEKQMLLLNGQGELEPLDAE